jgi:hypothetical protein
MLFRYAESCLKVNNARSRSRNSPPFTDRHSRDSSTRKVEFTCEISEYDNYTDETCIHLFQFNLFLLLENATKFGIPTS